MRIPKRITAERSATYDVQEILNSLMDKRPGVEPTLDDVMQIIEQYAAEDLSCGWGHTIDLMAISFSDADTNAKI